MPSLLWDAESGEGVADGLRGRRVVVLVDDAVLAVEGLEAVLKDVLLVHLRKVK